MILGDAVTPVLHIAPPSGSQQLLDDVVGELGVCPPTRGGQDLAHKEAKQLVFALRAWKCQSPSRKTKPIQHSAGTKGTRARNVSSRLPATALRRSGTTHRLGWTERANIAVHQSMTIKKMDIHRRSNAAEVR